MLEITENSTFKLKNTVQIRNVLGEAFFILDSDSGKQYNLTEMEYKIMSSIIRGKTFGTVVNEIIAEYDAPAEQIKTDLREYCMSLFDEGLIINN